MSAFPSSETAPLEMASRYGQLVVTIDRLPPMVKKMNAIFTKDLQRLKANAKSLQELLAKRVELGESYPPYFRLLQCAQEALELYERTGDPELLDTAELLVEELL